MRALITWELGIGHGRLAPLRPLIERLLGRGATVAIAAHDVTDAVLAFQSLPVEILPAPCLPRENTGSPHVISSYVELLTSIGWSRPDALMGLIRTWKNLYTLCEPDLILADHSPTALLAARGGPWRIEQMGTVFTCPRPDTLGGPELVPSVNAALKRMSAQEIRSIQDVFAVPTALLTDPILDPGPERPVTRYLYGVPHEGPHPPRWPSRWGKKIYARLEPSRETEVLIDTLRNTGLPIVSETPQRANPAGLLDDEAAATTLTTNPELAATTCDLAVLHGDHITALPFLRAGIPLLLVPLNAEHHFEATRIAAIDAAHILEPADRESPEDALRSWIETSDQTGNATGQALDRDADRAASAMDRWVNDLLPAQKGTAR